jgi:hypothetical protein
MTNRVAGMTNRVAGMTNRRAKAIKKGQVPHRNDTRVRVQ